MTDATQIHPDKLRAFHNTSYRLGHTEHDIVLKVGQYSPRLAELFAARGSTCGAFITAYNPRSTVQADAANQLAHAQLAAQLRALGEALGVEVIEGSGSEEGTAWPAERSYFALGLTLDLAKTVGVHFAQDAIVWVGADAIPQLILLR
jgi:hypothetical protein